MISQTSAAAIHPVPSTLPEGRERKQDAKEMTFVFVGEPNLDALRLLFQDVLKWSVEHEDAI